MGSCHSSAASGSSRRIQEGGGFQYTIEGRTFTIEQRNGIGYDVSDLAKVPRMLGNGINANELAKRAVKNGRNIKILTPKQMEERVKARNEARKSYENVDWELGMGVPGGNREYRKTARRNRLTSRVMKRK